MFDNSRYSLTRYSISTEKHIVEVAESFTENMVAVAGAAIPVDTWEKFYAAIQATTRGTISVPSALKVDEGLAAAVKAVADVVTMASMAEDITATARALKNIPAVLAGENFIVAKSYGSKNTPTSLSEREALDASAFVSKDKLFNTVVSEALGAVTEATSQTTETARVQITIPPGGELRIDSEYFTVTLNGENVLHEQSGDWINLSPELLRLIIENAIGGTLTGDIIFTERFL